MLRNLLGPIVLTTPLVRTGYPREPGTGFDISLTIVDHPIEDNNPHRTIPHPPLISMSEQVLHTDRAGGSPRN